MSTGFWGGVAGNKTLQITKAASERKRLKNEIHQTLHAPVRISAVISLSNITITIVKNNRNLNNSLPGSGPAYTQ